MAASSAHSNNIFLPLDSPSAQCGNDSVLWNNHLVFAPISYSLVERRLLYLLTRMLKHRFVEHNLGVPSNWQDLYFDLTDKDLKLLGGRTNVLQTYEALCDIHKKTVLVRFANEKGEVVTGHIHWIDAFFYNEQTETYKVRVSPEIMPYLINLSANFTVFSTKAALQLSSRFSQKFYEFCCCFQEGMKHATMADGQMLKKNVINLPIDKLRNLFALNEEKDARTGKIVRKAKYSNFADLLRRVIIPARDELYNRYVEGNSEVWFDYQVGDIVNRKVSSMYIYVYTHKSPKQGLPRPWQEGDEPLQPFERVSNVPATQLRMDMTNASTWKELSAYELEFVVAQLLERYLQKEEAWEYVHLIKHQDGNLHTKFLQVLQVIQEKEQQPKFTHGTAAYKRKAIKTYVLGQNLKEFGWCVEA
ncbi:MAG: replication initiation protein [Bacteroidaceae bacterium]|nr:replication initiation protein [Prevotellaceae bacterium]MDY5632874.1 replication initiation protein [Bacteroidaceae bacterium]